MNKIAQFESSTHSQGNWGDEPDFASRYPLSILVADCSYISRRSLNLMLEHLGYEPDPAETPNELVATAKAHSHDLILLDIDDPLMDAIEHAKQIRDARINTPIIVVTSYSPNVVRLDCAPANVNGYLTKPLNVGDVKQVLRQAYASVRHVHAA